MPLLIHEDHVLGIQEQVYSLTCTQAVTYETDIAWVVPGVENPYSYFAQNLPHSHFKT